MTHSHMWHDSFRHMTWLILIRGKKREEKDLLPMTHSHSHAPHDSFSFVTGLIKMYCYQYYIQTQTSQNSFVTSLILIRDMTHSHSWHDSSWRIAINTISKLDKSKLIRDMTHCHSWYDCSSWPILIRDIRDIRDWLCNHLIYSEHFEFFQALPRQRRKSSSSLHVTNENESCHEWEWVMSRMSFHYISNHYRAVFWEIVPGVGWSGSRAFTKKKCTRTI